MDFMGLDPKLVRSILLSCPVCLLIQENGIVTAATPYVKSFLGISEGDSLGDYIIGQEKGASLMPARDLGDYQNWERVDVKTKFGVIKHMEIKAYAATSEGTEVSIIWLQDVGNLERAEKTIKLVRYNTRKQARISREKTAKASYSLRKGLNSIFGLTELLEDGEADNKKREYLEQLRQAATELMASMEPLISHKSGRHAEKEQFSLQKILSKVENAIRLLLDKRSLGYEVLCQEDIPANLLGYPKHIQDVLVILSKNAIGFTREGSLTIRATEYDRDGESITLLFSVCDTGCGMPPEQVAALFPQFLLDDDDEDAISYKNGGLGLTTVQTLIDSIGGRMWCDSELGVGTTVYFTVRCEFVRDAAESGLAEISAAEDGYSAEGIKVLVVDDDKINQTVAAELLRKKGYTVVTADGGIEAVDMLKENGDYNLILMDVYMPDMDGPTTAKLIREMYPKLPIVALTACALPGDREVCLSLGMNDYFTKPFEAKNFLDLVRRWTS